MKREQLGLFSSVALLPDHHRQILERAAASYGCTVDELLSPSRGRSVVAARRAASVALRELGWSYPKIGRLLNRHHTTVLALVLGANEDE